MSETHTVLLAFREVCGAFYPILAFFGFLYVAEAIVRNIRSLWAVVLLIAIGLVVFLGMPLTARAESPGKCDARYRLTIANLYAADDMLAHAQPRPSDDLLNALHVVHIQVSSQWAANACAPSDVAMIETINATLYRKGLALPPVRAALKRRADAVAAQQRVLEQFQHALELLNR